MTRTSITVTLTPLSGQTDEDHDLRTERLAEELRVRFSPPQDLLHASIDVGPAHQELADIRTFHEKFGVPMSPVPAFLDPAATLFRQKFMQEELNEFHEAYQQRDLALAFDALLDLVYVTIGTALKMGLPWPQGWERVQEANMAKRLAKPDGSDSKRGSPMDVVKPEGWTPPDHANLLPHPPPIFNASEAISVWGEQRRIDKPLSHPSLFLEG